MAKLVEVPGININIQNEQGNTALHRCAEKCYFECMRILLDKRINPTTVNNKGETALDMALEKGDDDCVELLLSVMCDESFAPVLCNDNDQINNNNDQINNNDNNNHGRQDDDEDEFIFEDHDDL